MTHQPGREEFRSAHEYQKVAECGGLGVVSEAVDGDTEAAVEALEAEVGEVDTGGLMESLAVHAFGGDLRDARGWSDAATGGRLPDAWDAAVEEVVEG